MKREDCEYVKRVLLAVSPQDAHIAKAVAMVERDLAIYDAARGQLRESYEFDRDYFNFGGR